MLCSKNTQSCSGEMEREKKEWDAINDRAQGFPMGQSTQPSAIQTSKMQKQHTQETEYVSSAVRPY